MRIFISLREIGNLMEGLTITTVLLRTNKPHQFQRSSKKLLIASMLY